MRQISFQEFLFKFRREKKALTIRQVKKSIVLLWAYKLKQKKNQTKPKSTVNSFCVVVITSKTTRKKLFFVFHFCVILFGFSLFRRREICVCVYVAEYQNTNSKQILLNVIKKHSKNKTKPKKINKKL